VPVSNTTLASPSPEQSAPQIARGGAAACLEPAKDPDVVLMLEVSGGSETAFTELVQRHQKSLLNFFARMGASTECEDLVQETFVRLFRYRKSYRSTARFATFLYHLARNAMADHGRKVVRIERLAVAFQNEVDAASQSTMGREGDSIDVEAALNQLSPKLREVIVLNIYQGLRYQEVADVLEIPLGTVKSRINLALTALKEILHED